MCNIAFERTVKFWLRLDFIFDLTALGKDQKRALNILHGYTRAVIEEKMRQRKEVTPAENDASSDDIGKFGN